MPARTVGDGTCRALFLSPAFRCAARILAKHCPICSSLGCDVCGSLQTEPSCLCCICLSASCQQSMPIPFAFLGLTTLTICNTCDQFTQIRAAFAPGCLFILPMPPTLPHPASNLRCRAVPAEVQGPPCGQHTPCHLKASMLGSACLHACNGRVIQRRQRESCAEASCSLLLPMQPGRLAAVGRRGNPHPLPPLARPSALPCSQ